MLTSKSVDVVVKGTKKDLVDEDASLTVRGQRAERIDGDQSLTVVENQFERVSGSHALEAGKEIHLRSAENFAGEAADVTLRGPGGFLRIDASGVTIKGTVVKINVGGSAGNGRGSKPKLPKEPNEAPPVVPTIPARDAGMSPMAVGEVIADSPLASTVRVPRPSS